MPSANSESPRDERASGDEQPGHVRRVAGERQHADVHVAELDDVAVVQRLDAVGVLDPALQGSRRQPQRGTGQVGEGAGAREMVGMQVGVDDRVDDGAQLARRGESDVEAGVRRGVDDERAPARGEHVGQAAAAGPLHLADLEAVDAEIDRVRHQVRDPPAHAAIDDHRVDAERAQPRRDGPRGHAAVAEHGDGPGEVGRDLGGVVAHLVGGHVQRPCAGGLDREGGVLADVEHRDGLARGEPIGEVRRADERLRARGRGRHGVLRSCAVVCSAQPTPQL